MTLPYWYTALDIVARDADASVAVRQAASQALAFIDEQRRELKAAHRVTRRVLELAREGESVTSEELLGALERRLPASKDSVNPVERLIAELEAALDDWASHGQSEMQDVIDRMQRIADGAAFREAVKNPLMVLPEPDPLRLQAIDYAELLGKYIRMEKPAGEAAISRGDADPGGTEGMEALVVRVSDTLDGRVVILGDDGNVYDIAPGEQWSFTVWASEEHAKRYRG
jgi:hypothetical protein